MQIQSKRLASALAGIALVAGGAAYAATTSVSANAAGGKKVTSVAIATPAKDNDYGWNAQGVAGLKAAAKSYGITKVDVVQNIGYNNTTSVLRQLAQQGFGLIIAHASGYDTQAQQIAQQYKIPTVTYDVASEKSPGDLTNITTSSQQGAYLAGILAAKMTKTGTIGVIISASDTNWYEMEGGYIAGARSVNPKITIKTAQIGSASYDDSAGGKRVATSVIATGADVIFAMGDDASFGYLQAISTAKAKHKVWYIGDIGDFTPIDNQHVLLSSVLWNFTAAYKTFIGQIEHGTFGNHGYNLTLANGGISLLHSKYIPASVWSKIQTATSGIEKGSIKVPDTTTAGAVTKLLK
ncbi:MAG TPA: BMP family protein [Solirubrobacteraceae bacterium]|jgi:simple sugar transport system substrate-binding protein|nr:BMP family protein [Solirubrobacteraceae bacterium]